MFNNGENEVQQHLTLNLKKICLQWLQLAKSEIQNLVKFGNYNF